MLFLLCGKDGFMKLTDREWKAFTVEELFSRIKYVFIKATYESTSTAGYAGSLRAESAC